MLKLADDLPDRILKVADDLLWRPPEGGRCLPSRARGRKEPTGPVGAAAYGSASLISQP